MDIIIGQGAAGTAAAKTLKKLGHDVTVVTNETDCYYSRIDLPDVVSGKYRPEEATLQKAADFATQGITCLLGDTVTSIFTDNKTLTLQSGKTLAYDKLLIATGSTPVMPSIEGVFSQGIHCLWTMEQARRIIATAANARNAVVIGAGLIGLKTAIALNKRGLKVTVVEKMPRLLPQQLDEQGEAIVRARVESTGIKIFTGTQVTAFKQSQDYVRGVELDSGKELVCELAVVAVGVKPNTALAQKAGIHVGRGILTDIFLAASNPDIYAAGDVAEVADVIDGGHIVSATWPAAVEQGMIAARNMVNCNTPYEGYLSMNSVEFAGVPVIAAGDIWGADRDEIYRTFHDGKYKKVVVRNGVLRGILFVGEIRQAGVLVNNIIRQSKMEAVGCLTNDGFSFANLLAI